MGIIYSEMDLTDIKQQKYLDDADVEKCNELLKDSVLEIEKIVSEINKSMENEVVKIQKEDLLEFADRFSGKIKINKAYDKLVNRNTSNMENVEYVTENAILDISNGILKRQVVLTINPYEFVQEIIHFLSQMKNVEVYENTAAEVIHSLKDKVEVVTHNKFKILADKCIIATSVDAIQYFKDIDFEMYKSYTIATDKVLDKDEIKCAGFVAIDNNLPQHVIRFNNSNIIVSGEETILKDRIVAEDIEEKNFEGKYKKLFNYLQNIYKNEKMAKIKSCFYMVNAKTKDGLPLIDEIQNLPNVYCNLALGKNNIAYACIGGKMLQHICKDYYTKNMYLFRANR